jgi:hypothetical protein
VCVCVCVYVCVLLVGMGFEVRDLSCKAGVPPLEPHLQSIFAQIILEMGLLNYLFGLASNYNPPNYSLPSNYDYRCEPLEPSSNVLTLL